MPRFGHPTTRVRLDYGIKNLVGLVLVVHPRPTTPSGWSYGVTAVSDHAIALLRHFIYVSLSYIVLLNISRFHGRTRYFGERYPFYTMSWAKFGFLTEDNWLTGEGAGQAGQQQRHKQRLHYSLDSEHVQVQIEREGGRKKERQREHEWKWFFFKCIWEILTDNPSLAVKILNVTPRKSEIDLTNFYV